MELSGTYTALPKYAIQQLASGRLLLANLTLNTQPALTIGTLWEALH